MLGIDEVFVTCSVELQSLDTKHCHNAYCQLVFSKKLCDQVLQDEFL